jgi:ribosomal protein S2
MHTVQRTHNKKGIFLTNKPYARPLSKSSWFLQYVYTLLHGMKGINLCKTHQVLQRKYYKFTDLINPSENDIQISEHEILEKEVIKLCNEIYGTKITQHWHGAL